MNASNLPEFKQTQSIQSWHEPALSRDHRISYQDAGMIISSLHRCEKIIMFGRFIQMNEQGGEE